MATDADVLAIARSQIAQDEGCRLTAYPDPLSGAEPYTVGYGATGPSITAATVWTQDEADADLSARTEAICASLDTTLPWWRRLDAVRAAVLVNMQYQLGSHGLLAFSNMLDFVRVSEWVAAGYQMMSSAWARQTPNRAKRLAAQMQTGIQTYP